MSENDPISNVIIDRRPFWIVFVDRTRRGLFLTFLFVSFLFLIGQEGPDDLSVEGYKVLCLFALCVSLWTTNIIPLSVTSLLAISMVPLLDVMPASQVYAFFGNRAVFFILGAFILSGAMTASGLSIRMSLWVLERFGSHPRRLVSSIFFFAAVASCFMSEHAVATMLFPIVGEIVMALKLKPGSSGFGKSLYFAMAWGCIIGGATTALGGGRVPLAQEILEKNSGQTLGILQYTEYAFPMILLLLVTGWGLIHLFFKPDIQDISPAIENIRKKQESLGRLSYREIGIGTIMTVTLFFWFFEGENLGVANIALIAIVVLFAFNLISWEEVDRHVHWAIILMYGGAICLGEVMASSGAALWLAKKIFEGYVESPTGFLMMIAFLSTLFTTFMNNSAVIAVLLPPALSLSHQYGVSPTMATMTVILPSNFAFILPIATPASALAYSSRFVSLKEMMTTGVLLSGLGVLFYLLILKFYWPMMGFF